MALLVMLVGMPSPLGAQTGPRAGAFDLGGGALWLASSAVGDRKATETRNQTGSADRLTLFEVGSRLRSAPGMGAHVGFNLTSTLAIEGTLTYSRPRITTAVANDFERSPNLTLSDSSLQQYFIDAGVLVHLTSLRLGSRTLPFLAASVGYLRQVTEEHASVLTGRLYGIGGGLKQMLSPGGRVGLRVDARLGVRDGGLMLDDHRHRAFFMAGAGTFFVF